MNKTILLVFSVLLFFSGGAVAQQPPRIIAELRETSADSLGFGSQFAWVGDQNGDGYDDLLVCHYRDRGHYADVKLYFGGSEMDNEPDMVFHTQNENEFFVGTANYLGRLTPDNSHWFVIATLIWDYDYGYGGRADEMRLNFYKGGDDLDTIPDIVWRQPPDAYYWLGRGRHMRPSDFNGDGYDDLLVAFTGDVEEEPGAYMIFYGGAGFDTTGDSPDWVRWFYGYSRWTANAIGISTGGDVNGDGYDDFFDYDILRGQQMEVYSREYSLYLGSESMDTTSAYWSYYYSDFDTSDHYMQDFIIIPDVNGDGYDDWGCYWIKPGIRYDTDGYYLFYGSASPDIHPDLALQGSTSPWTTDGKIMGCDVNGDGFGDIITINMGGYGNDGEMHIHFGSRWMRGNADLSVNVSRTYGEYFSTLGSIIGAYGDFNGDGILDMVMAKADGDGYRRRILILGGSTDWRASVSEQTESSFSIDKWSIKTYPNPFNSELTVTITDNPAGNFSVSIHDLNGRVITQRHFSADAGFTSQHFSFTDIPTGVYLVKVTYQTTHQTLSKTAKIVLLH